MKSNSFSWSTLLAAAAAFLLATPAAWAAMGEMKSPSIYIGKDFPGVAKAKLDAALRHKDCKFLGGTWLNRWSTMKYSGNTRALNFFLDELSKVPGITLSVSFHNSDLTGPQDCDWRVGHMANSNRIQVSINLQSPNIQAGVIYIPEINVPATKK